MKKIFSINNFKDCIKSTSKIKLIILLLLNAIFIAVSIISLMFYIKDSIEYNYSILAEIFSYDTYPLWRLILYPLFFFGISIYTLLRKKLNAYTLTFIFILIIVSPAALELLYELF